LVEINLKTTIISGYFFALIVVFQVNAFGVTQLTKDEFSALRSEVLKMRSTARASAIVRVNEILEQYKNALTTRQTLRLSYAKALFQLESDQYEKAYATLIQCKLLADKLNEPYLTYFYYSYLGQNFTGIEMSSPKIVLARKYFAQSNNQQAIDISHEIINVGDNLKTILVSTKRAYNRL